MQKSSLYQIKRNIIRRVAVSLAAVFCCGMGSTNALSVSCGAGRTLPANTWLMTAPSCEPSPADLASQYSDDLSGPYDTDWLSFRWNSAPTAQNYVKQAGTDSLVPGAGNWLYSYKAGTLLLEGTATTTVPCSDYGSGLMGNCFAIDLTPSSGSNLWQIIGHPFPYTVSWADVRVAASSDGTSWTQYTPSEAATANLMAKEYWFWNGSSYQTKDDSTPGSIGVLQPQESIWVRIKSGSSSLNADNFKLLIPSSSDNWTVIGDIPEYSFSSEPLIDENTTFTMNVDPFDPLMLTAVTTNGWTVEYFALKDQMGAPVVLTGFHAQKDETGEYLEMEFDGEGHPISIEQQGNKKVILNWENYTIYGEKEWTVIGKLPDVSTIQPPVVDAQSEVTTNTNPSDPLWLTVTTTNGWVIKYFAKKDIYGAAKALVFISAEEIIGNHIIKTMMDDYGYPAKFMVNEGIIIALDWILREVRIEEGFLQSPIEIIRSSLTDLDACSAASISVNASCNFLSFVKGPIGEVLGHAVGGHLCGLATTSIGTGFCPSGSPDLLECNIINSGISHIGGTILGGVGMAALASGVGAIPVVVGGVAYSVITGIANNHICKQKYGNSSGDPHLRTFDGAGYDFQAVGEFIYLQSTQDPTEMTIQIRQGAWGNSKNIAANKAVAMSVGGDIVEINVANTPRLSINNTPVTMAAKEVKQLKNGCKIYAETQRKYWIIWKDNSMAEIRTYNNHLDISVSLPDSRKGSVKGLLGNSDGDKANDLQTRDGSIVFDLTNKLTKDELYNQFGNSWRITQEESLFTYAEGEDTATYTDLNFPYELVKASDLSDTVRASAEQTCRDAGITDPLLLEDCILDVGMTGDSTFADNMKDLKPPEQSITVTDDWLLYWDAQKAEGDEIVRITPNETWKNGMAFSEGALNLDGDFEKTFNIYMGDSDSGGEGIIFLLLPKAPPQNITQKEATLQILFNDVCNGKPCLGVEIDTFSEYFEPAEDHIDLIINGDTRDPIASMPLSANIEDGEIHSLTISWKKKEYVLSIALDDTFMFYEADIKDLLGTSTVTFGFVGATTKWLANEQYFYPVTSF